jgi:tetratricopeptide (TPR) repeat protein
VSVVLIVVAVRAWRRSAWPVVFAIVALLLSYLPTSNALTLIRVFFAERLWYLPSVWAAVLLGHAVARVWRFRPVKVVITAMLCAAVARLWVRNAEWRHDGALYAAAVRDQPEGVQPMYLFGQWLVEHGRAEEGISHLHRAVQIDLGYADAHRALGSAYVQVGRVPEALRHLQTAQMQAPGHLPTERALAAAGELMAERANQELQALEQAAQANPDDLAAMLALARKLREVNRVVESLRRLESGADRFGRNADWQRECAVTLVMLNRVDEAIERYRRAVELRSADAQSKIELAMLLLERGRKGDLAEADVLTNEAAEQAGGEPAVLAGRAEVLAALGRVHDAIQTYRQAIEILPAEGEQRRVYGQRLRALGG